MKTTLDMTIPQMCMMRSLISQGVPANLIDIFLVRCDLDAGGWKQLIDAGYVELRKKDQRYWQSDAGKRAYNVQKKHKWF